MILRLNYSNLVLPPFHHSFGIWLTDTYSIGIGNTAHARVSLKYRILLHSPIKFYLSLSGFHASPNSSRARECNCLYYATHTRNQRRKFPHFFEFIFVVVFHLLTLIFSTCLQLESKNSITLFQLGKG